jgi:hypothetical protein
MFRIPLEHLTARARQRPDEGGTMGTANGTDRLHDALGALDAARTIGDPVSALAALDVLDAESAGMRRRLMAELDTVGHEPLDGTCRPINGRAGPAKIATPEMGHTPTDHRVSGGGYH